MGKNTSGLTLWDVAHAAGVSLGTASRVINGGKNVSPAMLEKVQASILKLGYEPNQTARALASGRTSMVGLLVPSIADPFFSNCAEAAEKVARKYDSLLILAVSNNDVATEREKLSALLRQRPDGLLVVPSDGENITFRRFVRDTRVPIVTFDRPTAGCPSVLTDNYDAALKATCHLIEHGYQRILCYGGEPHIYTIKERLRGYRDAIKHAGLVEQMDASFSESQGDAEDTIRRHILGSNPPDAIFTLKNSTTMLTLQVLQSLHITVPQKIGLLGFDDFPLAGSLTPYVSVVRQPIYDVGLKAAELLYAMLEANKDIPLIRDSTVARSVTLKSQLIVRSSCGCPALTSIKR